MENKKFEELMNDLEAIIKKLENPINILFPYCSFTFFTLMINFISNIIINTDNPILAIHP